MGRYWTPPLSLCFLHLRERMKQFEGPKAWLCHAGASSNKNDKFEHVHMQKNQHFKEKHSFP